MFHHGLWLALNEKQTNQKNETDSFWCIIQSILLSPTQLSSIGWLDFSSNCSFYLFTEFKSLLIVIFLIRSLKFSSSFILSCCSSNASFMRRIFASGVSSGCETMSGSDSIIICCNFFKFWLMRFGSIGIYDRNGFRNECGDYFLGVRLGCFFIFPMLPDKIIKILYRNITLNFVTF